MPFVPDKQQAAPRRRFVPDAAPSRATEPQYDPTEGMSGYDKFMAGAGKSVVDLGRGIRQLGAEASAVVTGDRTRADQLRREQDEVNKRDRALMNTGAGVAGNITGTIATTLLPAGAVARGAQAANLGRTAMAARAFTNPLTYRAAAAAGAVQGGLQAVGTDESRTKNVLVGAALGTGGQAAANTVARVAQPITRALTKEDKAAVRVLDKAGVPLDVVQRSGSKAAEVVKRAVDDNPFTGPGQKAFAETQRTAFTRAVLKTIGADADAATVDVMSNAANKIGGTIGDIADRNPIPYDNALHSNLVSVYQRAKSELAPDNAKVINNKLSDIFEKAQENGGSINGHAYRDIKASLDRISKEGGGVGHWAEELRDAVEDALQRSAKGDDFKQLKQARLEYWRLNRIIEALPTDGSGQISPANLANRLAATKSAKKSMHLGKGDRELVILAQAGKKMLPDKFPNSGTPARIAGQLLAPSAIGLGTGYASGDAETGVVTALGSAAALRGGRSVLNNQRTARLLTEGLKPGRARNVLTAAKRGGRLGHVAAVSVPAGQE